MCVYAINDPETTSAQLATVYNLAALKFETVFQYGALIILVFLVSIALSKVGNKKINVAGASEYSLLSWSSMLFAAGMGASILYWSPIEWAAYYSGPPFDLEVGSDEALLTINTYTSFHWGFSGWAIYALPAVAFAIATTLNKSTPLTFGSLLIHKDLPFNNFLKSLFDVFFIFGILAGAGVGLGLSFPLIAEVIANLLGIPSSLVLEMIILLICLTIITTSAYLGITKGIKRLSNINIVLVIMLLIFVLLVGPTQYIISTSFDVMVNYVQDFIKMSTYTGSQFVQSWTVFYWAWWLALAPYLGVFFVNISNGKSIRQLILGTIIIGGVGSILHFLIIGNYSLHLFETGALDLPTLLANERPTKVIVDVISSLPLNTMMLTIYGIISIIFLCTTYDSCAFILSKTAMKTPDMEPSKILRIVFSALLVVQPAILMYLGGLQTVKYMLVITSIPLIFINILLIGYIFKNVQKI
ncbi:BCCT family transporter [Gammaproteobacteria bacterium]|nr:BCCT family transporter [Gammaproteobacteria bacterium]